jgi:transposase
MRPQGNAEELERRRFRAVELMEEGVPRNLLARVFGVSPTSLSRWMKLAETDSLRAKPHPGAPPRLTDEDCAELEGLLLKGAPSYGWQNNLWTTGRVAHLIRETFGITYHPGHVSRILRGRLNWTCQRPVNQNHDRDDEAIARWIRRRFRRIVERAKAAGGCLVFVDETGFMLEPNVRRTYAPCGRTPTNRISSPHSRISVAGAITLDPCRKKVGLVYRLLPDNRNFRGESITAFLRSVRARVDSPMTVLWDQIPIHQGALVEQCVANEPGVVIEPFPPYAPELNPADGIWRYVKHGRLPNYAVRDLGILRKTVIVELQRVRRREKLLWSFIRFTKLPLDL